MSYIFAGYICGLIDHQLRPRLLSDQEEGFQRLEAFASLLSE